MTGTNSSGASIICEDRNVVGVAIPQRPGFVSTNLWVTRSTPAPVQEVDHAVEHKGLHPPASGTVFRVVDFPSESGNRDELAAGSAGIRAAIYSDLIKDEASKARHPGMHRTMTVDYAIVLTGEIYAVMEEGETLLRTGDVLIQRGTNHAWSNRSGRPCRMAFILIGGTQAAAT